MTKEQLEKIIAKIESDCKEMKYAAYRQFVNENAKYKIGDVITDGVRTIRVDNIGYSVYCNNIDILYTGIALTKKRTTI
jgi:hypothetical protein